MSGKDIDDMTFEKFQALMKYRELGIKASIQIIK